MKHLQESLDAEKPLTDEDVKDIEVLLDEVNPDFLPVENLRILAIRLKFLRDFLRFV